MRHPELHPSPEVLASPVVGGFVAYIVDEEDIERLKICERRLRAMTEWLEANQPDVFSRGLWDALNAA